MAIVCRGCGTENPDGSAFCNACGAKLDALRPAPAQDGKTCPHCGASNPAVVSFCQYCAKEFPKLGPIGQQAHGEHQGRKCWRCGAAAGSVDSSCHACGADLPGSSCESFGEARTSRKPEVAAVLFAGAGILDIMSSIRLLTLDGYLPDYGVDVSGFLEACGALAFVFGCCALLAAVLAYRRKGFALTLFAGTLGMLGAGPFLMGSVLSLTGITVVALSRDEAWE